MATLLSLKRRIKAAQNVSKTTKAMQMIAASKLKRAQDATLASRPYVQKLSTLVSEIAGRIDEKNYHPYMKMSKVTTGKTLIIALSPDKGLCGGLITNLLKEFFAVSDTHKNASYVVFGKKLEGQVAKLQNEVLATFQFGTTLPTFDVVYPLTQLINEYYLGNKVDSVQILYTDFTSIFSQTPKVAQLLPISLTSGEEDDDEQLMPFSLFEPNAEELLPELLKHYMEMQVYQYFLESFVSEQASRMLAMQNATNNAKDIITDLRLEYNKTRQAKITSELLDITGSKNAQGGNEI